MTRRKGQVVTDMIEATSSESVTGGPQADARLSVEQLAVELMDRARDEGVSLVGPGGLLAGLTKTVLESALEGELTEHLGYDAYDPAGHHSGNSRNGTRPKTVLTEIGPIALEVPRDRAGSFEPVIVPKRRRRLHGVDALVCSLSAKGLTHGEICAHLAEIYGAEVSKETITRITDRVLEGMTEWQNRPLDSVYPVIFIDAIVVKIREGQVANRPIYVAIGVTTEGTRDILGLWAGEGGEGAKYWAHVLHRDQEPRGQGCVHRGVRRAERAARRGELGVAAGHRAGLCGPSAQEFVPLRFPQGLAGHRQGPQAHLHRRHRGGRAGPFGGVLRAVGGPLPGHREAVGERLGRVRAVPQFRHQYPRGDLHHECH